MVNWAKSEANKRKCPNQRTRRSTPEALPPCTELTSNLMPGAPPPPEAAPPEAAALEADAPEAANDDDVYCVTGKTESPEDWYLGDQLKELQDSGCIVDLTE